jgi:hypothetical protein
MRLLCGREGRVEGSGGSKNLRLLEVRKTAMAVVVSVPKRQCLD